MGHVAVQVTMDVRSAVPTILEALDADLDAVDTD